MPSVHALYFWYVSFNRELKEIWETKVPLVAKEQKERRHVSTMSCTIDI